MPGTFPKSHLAQFNLKYLQVKSNLVLSSKTDNTITITILNPPFFPKEEVTLRRMNGGRKRRQRRRNPKAKRVRFKLEKQPLFLMVFISYS